MVIHWLREPRPGWVWRLGHQRVRGAPDRRRARRRRDVKFVDGAYLVVILIPVLVGMMLFIHRQYAASRASSRPDDFVAEPPQREERVVVPVPGINRAVVQAVNVGRSIADDVRAVFITDEPEDAGPMRALGAAEAPGVPLVVVESPYRALVGPLAAYLDVLDAAWPPDKEAPITFVVIPEYVARTVVGADPLQPVGQAAAERAPRPAAHGRRQRPLSARGPASLSGAGPPPARPGADGPGRRR